MSRVALLALLTAALCGAQERIESPHVPGPRGLTGWTISEVVTGAESQGPLPVQLVIAQNGRVIRRIDGDLLLWRWIFLNNGRFVAYETGPLHFSLTYHLVTIRSGREVDTVYECSYCPPRSGMPDWVKALERSGNTPPLTP